MNVVKMPEITAPRKATSTPQNGVLKPIARIAHQPLIPSKIPKAPSVQSPVPQKALSIARIR